MCYIRILLESWILGSGKHKLVQCVQGVSRNIQIKILAPAGIPKMHETLIAGLIRRFNDDKSLK